jgi:hypothetical protein
MTTVTHDEFKKMTPWFRRQVQNNQLEIPAHLRSATNLTKFGELNYANHKGWKAVAKPMKAVKSSRESDMIERLSEDNLGVAAV